MDQLSFSFQRIITGYPLKHSLLLMYLKLKTAKICYFILPSLNQRLCEPTHSNYLRDEIEFLCNFTSWFVSVLPTFIEMHECV